MRFVIVLLLLTQVLVSNAQPSDELPVRFHIDLCSGVPNKNFKAGQNDNYLTGQAKQGWGFSLKASKAILGNLYVGLSPRMMYYSFDQGIIKNHILAKHDNGKVYSEAYVSLTGVFLYNIGGQISWVFNTNALAIEPFIETGVVFAELDSKLIKTRRKWKNSNYTDSVNIYNTNPGTPAAMYGMFGLRLNKKVAKRLNLSVSASYTTTESIPFSFRTEEVDYFDRKHDVDNFTERTAFTTIQFEMGVQFRFFRSKGKTAL